MVMLLGLRCASGGRRQCVEYRAVAGERALFDAFDGVVEPALLHVGVEVREVKLIGLVGQVYSSMDCIAPAGTAHEKTAHPHGRAVPAASLLEIRSRFLPGKRSEGGSA